MKIKSNRINAFTLVELMVILAIIAGLLLMVMPNVRKQRARARAVQCRNNLRQYGVAMNQYMANNGGYFVRPAISVAGKVASTNIDMGGYADGIYGYGGQGGSAGDKWSDFIVAYIPEPNITDIKFLRSGQNSVRICPEVNRKVFDPGTTNRSNPEFKGYRSITDSSGETYQMADFESEYGYTAEGDLILSVAFTTYGINRCSGVYTNLRSQISNDVVAFIDWNAEEGWGANIINQSPSVWMYTGRDRNGNPVRQDSVKPLTNWWHSEIGFYHPGRSNDLVANYVAMDGSVQSVSSNEISLEYFR